jgi:hypothetical protein
MPTFPEPAIPMALSVLREATERYQLQEEMCLRAVIRTNQMIAGTVGGKESMELCQRLAVIKAQWAIATEGAVWLSRMTEWLDCASLYAEQMDKMMSEPPRKYAEQMDKMSEPPRKDENGPGLEGA